MHCLAVPGTPEEQYEHTHRHNGEEDKRVPDETEHILLPWAEGHPLLLCPVCGGTMFNLSGILQSIMPHETVRQHSSNLVCIMIATPPAGSQSAAPSDPDAFIHLNFSRLADACITFSTCAQCDVLLML